MEDKELKEMIGKAIAEAVVREQKPKESESGLLGLLGWKKQPSISSVSAVGVSVPVKMESSAGSVRVYFAFPAEFAEPEKLSGLLETLINAGVPVDAWKPQQNKSWGGRK
jgi:hypothetical protein